MDDGNDTAKLYDGLEVNEYFWGRVFTGSEAALVAAGLVQSEWLPGKPGGNKYTTVVIFEDGKGRLHVGRRGLSKREYMNIQRKGKDRYSVRKDFSPAEAKNKKIDDESKRIEKNLKKIRENEAKEIGRLPANSDEYRASILECAEWFLEAIRHAATSGNASGYSLAYDFLAIFDIAVGQITGAIQTGTINFDRAKRSAVIAEINQQAAEERREADPEFAAFLGATLMSAKAAIPTSN